MWRIAAARSLSSSSAAPPAAGPLAALLEAARSLLSPGEPAYATHVPLTPLQRGAVAALAALGAASDPRRADLVAAVGEATGAPALRAARDRLRGTDAGRALLAARPRVTGASVAAAWDRAACPPGSFGAAYAAFMGARGFSADERPPVRFVDDGELAWVAARLRECHDFWHVLFGLDTDVFGETALKAVEFAQTGLPAAAAAVAAGAARLGADDRRALAATVLPWALRAGSRAADLLALDYEAHLGEPLEELRARWRIAPAPPGARPSRRRRAGAGAQGAAEGGGGEGAGGRPPQP